MELAHDDMVYVTGFSDDASCLLTGTRNQTAQVWDRSTGARLGPTLVHRDNPVQKTAFSHDGQWVATVSTGPGDDDVIRIWDWRNAALVSQEIHTEGRILSLAFSDDDRMILANSFPSSSPDKVFTRIWELAPSPGNPVDLAALTEATVARVLTEQGGYAEIDPFTGWQRIRSATPGSWFLQDPARRGVSPNISASSMNWITDPNLPISQALHAMPAVGVVRAAVAYWENIALLNRIEAWKKLDSESPEAKKELASMQEANARVLQLRQLAERNAVRDAGVCYYLGLTEKRQRKYADARKWVLQGLKLEPDREDLRILANDVLYLSEDPETLEAILDKLIGTHPDNSAFLARKGYLLWNRNQEEAAKPVLEAALACKEAGLENRVIILNLLGRSGEADKLLDENDRESREKDPTYQPQALTWLYRLMTCESAGYGAQAIEAYRSLAVARNGALTDDVIKSLDYPQAAIEIVSKVHKAALSEHPELGKLGAE
jgi:tetratricopeptide (TPR) repeat protein